MNQIHNANILLKLIIDVSIRHEIVVGHAVEVLVKIVLKETTNLFRINLIKKCLGYYKLVNHRPIICETK